MLSLYSEIIVSILGASLLGLFAGWMIQKSLNKGKLAGTVALWEDRLKAAEDDARRDSEHLEDQLQSMGDEVKKLNDTNRSLKSSLQDNDTGADQERSEALEINRQQTETQERLQRIIQEKDQEISLLRSSVENGQSHNAASGIAASLAAGSVIDREFADDTAVTEFENGATVNLDDQTEVLSSNVQEQLNTETENTQSSTISTTIADTLDDTARLGTTSSHPVVETLPNDPYDATLDATADMADNSMDYEEETVALDEDALNFARAPRHRD